MLWFFQEKKHYYKKHSWKILAIQNGEGKQIWNPKVKLWQIFTEKFNRILQHDPKSVWYKSECIMNSTQCCSACSKNIKRCCHPMLSRNFGNSRNNQFPIIFPESYEHNGLQKSTEKVSNNWKSIVHYAHKIILPTYPWPLMSGFSEPCTI